MPLVTQPDAETLARKRDEGRTLRVIGSTVEVIALPQVGDLVIGRGAEADIRIDDGSISRKHAMLSIGPRRPPAALPAGVAPPSSGPRVRIKDLGSANGTRVADRALEPGEWADVNGGEVIDLGSVVLVLTGGEASAPKAEGAMARADRLVERIAPGDIAVLLQGETGVGKEVFAERIHGRSRARASRCSRLNCGGFTETLLESELFGHEKGAFTGARQGEAGAPRERRRRHGVPRRDRRAAARAPGASLLRVLEDRKVQRVGALEPRAIDVRFIAATNRDLAAEIARGSVPPGSRTTGSTGVTAVDPAAARAHAPRSRRSRRSSSRAVAPTARLWQGRARAPRAPRVARQHPRAAERRSSAPR